MGPRIESSKFKLIVFNYSQHSAERTVSSSGVSDLSDHASSGLSPASSDLSQASSDQSHPASDLSDNESDHNQVEIARRIKDTGCPIIIARFALVTHMNESRIDIKL